MRRPTMPTVNRIYPCDARTGLQRLPKESVDMVIASPPYWSLRDYGGSVDLIWNADPNCKHRWGSRAAKALRLTTGNNSQYSRPWREAASGSRLRGQFCRHCSAWRGQLGLEPTFDLYVKHLCDLFDDVRRVLKSSGTCWVNLGDTYSGSNCGVNDHTSTNRCKPASYAQMYKGQKAGKTSLPNKSLCLVPFRFAVEMTHRGWILRNVIIWHKPNCMPASVKDRFTVDFEYLFFFVKNQKYSFEQQREPHKKTSIARTQYAWNGHREPMSSYFNMDISKMCHPDGRNKRCVWRIPTQPFPGAHFAPYPEVLCETPILAGCPIDGVVLDPFMGSGTTAVVARRLNRSFIGFEPNPSYVEIAKQRLRDAVRPGRARKSA